MQGQKNRNSKQVKMERDSISFQGHGKNWLMIFCAVQCFFFWAACTSSPKAKMQTRPILEKLPFAFPEKDRTLMENTPVTFGSKLLLVANHRPGGAEAKGEDAHLYIYDLETGREICQFGKGHSFVSAFVNGNELNVFALEFSNFGRIIKSKGISRFVTNDLKNWKQEAIILPEGGEYLFNTSVCKDKEGFLMAYESDKPVKFCFKFARSKDLAHWEKISDLTFTGEHKEYSACPTLRFFAPYYYVIYLHAPLEKHNGWISYMARSDDLKQWELSPFNPILEADSSEGTNSSDVDIIEVNGKTYLFYATGDQQTWSTIRVAMYNGHMKNFYEEHFPNDTKFMKISAKR